MKYVILIHSNPDPWGHPTQILTEEGRALPKEQHAEMDRQFEALMTEISASGEFVTAEALGDPASATCSGGARRATSSTEGPYAEAKEHLAGFFLIDCRVAGARRGDRRTSSPQPGGVVELRPAMWPGGDDQ